MRNFLLVIIFFIQSFFSYSNNYKIKKVVIDPPDTVPSAPIQFFDEQENEMYSDEIFIASQAENTGKFFTEITTNDFLKAWDTTNINPFIKQYFSKKDPTKIQVIYDAECDFFPPVKGIVTSEFGMRHSRYHYGIDIDLDTGDPVYATFEGIVRLAGPSSSYGNYVIISHPNGLETLYAHLSAIHVKTGQYLQAGDKLGLGGSTGWSTGPHLHFEISVLGKHINPRDVISFEKHVCHSETLNISSKNFSYLNNASSAKSVAQHQTKLSNVKKKVSNKKSTKSRKKVIYYTVKKGDTITKIANRNKMTVAQLYKLNRIGKKSKLKPGKTLRVS